MANPTTKFCGACQTEKPVSEFIDLKNGREGPGGYHSECRECGRKRYNEWRKKNREKHAKRNNEWHHRNREVSLAHQAAYLKRIDRRPRRIAEYEKHGSKIRARALAWAKANPEKRRLQYLRREAFKRQLPHNWTLKQMQAALKYWGNCCPVCGVDLDGKRHWDHWIPLINNECPGTVANNMLPLCQRCNMRKHDSLPNRWLKLMFPSTWQQILRRVESYLNSR